MKILLSSKGALLYVDDLHVGGRNEGEHDRNLKDVIKILLRAKMHVNTTKI